jgi:hypothetical protein
MKVISPGNGTPKRMRRHAADKRQWFIYSLEIAGRTSKAENGSTAK